MTLRTHRVLIIALAAAGFSIQGIAQTDHSSHGHGGQAAMHAPSNSEAALDEGVVKKIDKPAGKIAVAHAAQNNGMAAMTMVYRVKDATWLDKMQVGQKIRFATDPADGGMTVVRFELVK